MQPKPINVKLDLNSKEILVLNQSVVQGDTLNQLNVQLISTRTPYDLTGVDSIKALFTKSDRTTVEKDMTVTDAVSGRATCTIPPNGIAVVGDVICTVNVSDNGERLTFQEFKFPVRKDNESEAVQSTSEFPILNQLIQDGQNIINGIDEMRLWESYNPSKAYVPLNKVVYQGSSYICIANSQGVAPSTDTSKWLPIAMKGNDGLSSLYFATYTASSNGITHVVHNLSYNPLKDELECIDIAYNSLMEKGTNYTENADNISIDLIGGSLNTGDKIRFRLFKNIK